MWLIQDTEVLSPLLWWMIAGILGLVVGSFVNVVVHRLPLILERQWQADAEWYLAERERDATPVHERLADLPLEQPDSGATAQRFDLAYPPSRCPSCGRRIKAWENIPVVSYLLLRARCPGCGTPISPMYPLVELGTGLAFVLAAIVYGQSAAFIGAAFFSAYLITGALIDARTTLLPDSITLPLLWAGLAFNATGVGFTELDNAVWGAIAGYLSLWLVFHAFKLATGKEGMGHGDFKLLAAIGAWLGWTALPMVLLMSSLVGAVVGLAMIMAAGRDRAQPIPFGPYLAGGGLIMLYAGDLAWRWIGP
ncbi:MAG: prepilin peptidase [Thioalkalivibrionaceae bacterium]